MPNEQLDELDLKILEQLNNDGRMSYREIGRKLRIALGTVASRVKALEQKGIIKGYSVILDHEQLGYDFNAIIEIFVAKGKLVEVEKRLAERPNVCAVYDVTGEADALIIAKFRGRRELNDFVKNILKMEEVEHTNTHIVFNTVKEDFRLTR
ncbi:Lrp/AsnC family transcriptional regulator [Candidatus Woesearchaeota archaeon]|nr:Lrp/AsnC family transcriptional regulator [Candidatus Woesearchaeota archaeon]